MAIRFDRRKIIALLGCGAFTRPAGIHAQNSRMPVIGYLGAETPVVFASRLTAFRQGLREGGYVEGRNVTIEFRWAESQHSRLAALAAELVDLHVDVIAAPGGVPAALAAKSKTKTIPIIFENGSRPCRTGDCRQFEPSRWQPHRRNVAQRGACAEAIGTSARIAPYGYRFCCSCKSEQSHHRTAIEKPGSSSLGSRVAASCSPSQHFAGLGCGVRFSARTKCERPRGRLRYLLGHSRRTGCRPNRPARRADDPPVSRLHCCWRLDELWRQLFGVRIVSPAFMSRGSSRAKIPLICQFNKSGHLIWPSI